VNSGFIDDLYSSISDQTLKERIIGNYEGKLSISKKDVDIRQQMRIFALSPVFISASENVLSFCL
jgi:hypothetical protein